MLEKKLAVSVTILSLQVGRYRGYEIEKLYMHFKLGDNCEIMIKTDRSTKYC